MRILMINTVCGIGSTGRICTDLADILMAHGHDCRIAYGRGEVPEKYRNIDVKIGSMPSIYFHGLKARLFDASGFGSKYATERFIKWVQSFDPDVIHIHNIHGYYLNIEVLFRYLKTCGKKIVWTLHDCWAMTGHCTHFDYVGCEKWMTGCNHCEQRREYPSSLFIDNSAANYQKKRALFTGIPNMEIVTPSKWLAEIVKASFLNEYHVTVISNGVDRSVFRPTESSFRSEHNLENKQMLLGVANIWNGRKGLSDFFELSKILDDNYRLVLVGLNKRQMRKLPPNIMGITHTNSVSELAEIYSAADVYINTSLEETMGLTTIEALSCGTPAIVYNRTAVPEVIENDCGIVLENNTPEYILMALPKARFDANACIARADQYDKIKKEKEYCALYGI